MGCKFCLTGSLGLIRNLKAYEIADQIITVNRLLHPQKKITNIVFMGMGEPLANFDEVVEALWRIVRLVGISKRKVTLSTAGLIPKIALLAEKAPEVNLAISLNAATDAFRTEIMPVNKKYPLKSLIDACRKYPLSPQRRITFEYVLLAGVNDSPADARRLAKLVAGIPCKVNLIVYNAHDAAAYAAPGRDAVDAFQAILTEKQVTSIVRESRGGDVAAACGQLGNVIIGQGRV